MKILGIEIKRYKKGTPKKRVKKKGDVNVPPNGRVTEPTYNNATNYIEKLKGGLNIIKPEFQKESIPLIRKLYKVNGDMGSVLFDLVQLTNTGHKIEFSQTIKEVDQDNMRRHLEEVTKRWGQGTAGINGLVNKLITQVYVSGALSAEQVINPDLTGIDYIALVNPETIYFSEERGKYQAYQKARFRNKPSQQYIKLNMNTYKYYGLISDIDTPYGVPPFLSALEDISMQKDMKNNIKHILNQLGLLGYLEVKIDKPGQKGGETANRYENRLIKLLTDTKRNMLKGFKDGVVVGYEGDHEFDFHSTTKNLSGVNDLFNLNENQIANGLKTSATFLGVKDGTSEGFVSIVFTKMLSQLKNVQNFLAEFLQEAYKLELQLAGYDCEGIKVIFKPSTITDDLKIQQSREIKQRVLRNLWMDGIISIDRYAEEMGYEEPDEELPRPSRDMVGIDPQVKKEDREKQKDKSDRKVREKNKPQPKRKDQKTQ